MGVAVSSLAFPVPPKGRAAEALLARPDLLYLTTEADDQIAAVHIRRGATGTDRVVLYSHGNAEDLGQRLPYLDLMSSICATDVFAYDYCGYGFSEGTPSEENCILAINAAYEYLLQHFSPNRIFVFGRSIGSGPTVDLAMRHAEIRGVILQSPLESCGRAVFGNFGSTVSWVGYRFDLFRNYEKIPKVTCPVLVMHGTADDIVRTFLDESDGLSWGWNIFVTSLATQLSVKL
mmetsp:Transcript_60514/g.136388  ORF Transcript_60514/g.136388 Transcript_60514/m.136388 type:complete len:233 (+) Transcript_60514:72-770(+)